MSEQDLQKNKMEMISIAVNTGINIHAVKGA